MVNNRGTVPQNRRQSHRSVNPYETGQPTRPSTLGGLAKDIGRGVAGAFGDMASDAYSDALGRSPRNFDNQNDQGSPDKGGVAIPTFEQYRQQQERKNSQFFDMKRQEEEAARKRREEEDQKQLDEVYKELEKEIKRYEAQQQKMDENIEKLKKLIIAERTNKYKKGKYAFTVSEIGKMIMKTALISITDSNNWLEAVMTKRKKRGSLFAVRSKKQGTQYSMSQELSLTRSVQ